MHERDADDLADLRATQRNLHSFLREGLIDNETFGWLRHHIQEQRRQLEQEEERAAEPNLFTSLPIAPAPILELPGHDHPTGSAPKTEPDLVEPPVPVSRDSIADSREAAPKDETPRRGVYGWFAAFMEERHILWGELVGGLLMVGCSITLVQSLWQTLEQIPLFPFIILATITVMLFGAGHYTLHNWKLEATSRGLVCFTPSNQSKKNSQPSLR